MRDAITRPDSPASRLILAGANLGHLTALEGMGWKTFDFSMYRLQAAVRGDPQLRQVETILIELPDAGAPELAELLLREQPDIIGLSAYVWSFPALAQLAREIKARRPEVFVIMGGPSARPAMWDLAPFRDLRRFVDAVCVGDGEDTLRDILHLQDRSPRNLREIDGLAVPSSLGWSEGRRRPRMERLDDLDSPYQMDLVPTGLTAILETFRGCPISCRFCEWGVMESPRSVFSVDYLKRELEGMRRSNPSVVICADAGLNLNARAFRNLAKAESEVGVLREIPLTCSVYPSHLNDEQLEFLANIRLERLALGLQTFNPAALKAMDRPFDPKRFDGAIKVLADNRRTVIELIAGLPGDDHETFVDSFDQAMSYGCDVVISHCLVLPDGLMTRAPDDACIDFDPYTLKMKSCKGWPEGQIEKVMETCRLRGSTPEE